MLRQAFFLLEVHATVVPLFCQSGKGGEGPVIWLGRKVEALEVFRMVGDIFSQNLRLLRQKKYVKMASIMNICDRFPCEIA